MGTTPLARSDVARFLLNPNRLLNTRCNKSDMLHHESRRPRNVTHHEAVTMSFKTQSAFPPSRTAQTGRRCATLEMGIRHACGSPPFFFKSPDDDPDSLTSTLSFFDKLQIFRNSVASRFSLLACVAISLAAEGLPCSPRVTTQNGEPFFI